MINHNLVNRIIAAIRHLENEYQSCQGLILSEDDLKCLIFKKICALIPTNNLPTADSDVTGSVLHTEIPFYDERGRLRLKPDITIFDPRGMSIKHGLSIRIGNNRLAYGKLPSKGFEFGGKAIVIEIKFCKRKQGITAEDTNKIKGDIDKITGLMQRHNRPQADNEILGIMVVFNKTNLVDRSFHLLQPHWVHIENPKFVYGTGNVTY